MDYKYPSSLEGRNTPQVFTGAVRGPYGRFFCAPFLPLVRFEPKFETYIVIPAGKVVGYAKRGTSSWIIPAGLALQAAAFKTAFEAADLGGGITSISKANGAVVETDAAHNLSVGDEVVLDAALMTEMTTATAAGVAVTAVGDATHFTLGSINSTAYTTYVDSGTWASTTDALVAGRAASGVELYSATDVTEGVLNAQGVAVVAGESVVESFFTPASLLTATLVYDWTLTVPTGCIIYNGLRHYGGLGNPTDYDYLNFKPQNGVAFVRSADMEIPAVSSIAGLRMAGLTVAYISGGYISAGSALRTLNGLHLTYNTSSDFTLVTSSETSVAIINDTLPLSEMPVNFTSYVQNGQTTLPDQFRMAGSATGGVDNNVFLAGPNVIGKLFVSMQVL